MRNSRLKYLLILGIVLTLITGLGATYSFFIYRKEASNVSLQSGEISINYSDNVNYLTVPDAYPVSDGIGKIYPYYSDFTINGVTDTHAIKYEIQIIPNSNNTIDGKYIKVYLTDQNDNAITNPTIYENLQDASYNSNGKTVHTGYFTSSNSKEFRLRVWIDESYTKNIKETFGFTIYLYAVNAEVDFLYDILETSLANNLKQPDVDGTRYVTGATVDNNYVWYSGKMWRIVALNDDGTVRLVTQDNINAIQWATSSSNTDYSQSQMRSWLNTEFIKTINSNLIVESNWDYTSYENFPTEKDIENAISVPDKVGILSVYDLMMTGGTDSLSTTKTFLNNGYFWWMSSPRISISFVWIANNSFSATSIGPSSITGVRPSVNLKSNIILTGEGNGEIETPYMLEGDTKVGQASELLSSRISGEYIKFNNTKYRIVGIENGLTKITMADYSKNKNTLTTSIKFGASKSEITFSPTYGIGKYLTDWYNATSENDTSNTYTGLYLEKTYKDMIATPSDGVRWYAGPDNGTGYDYTKSTQGPSIEAVIGLGRYGEMFSTQFGNGYASSTDTWLMTKYSDTNAWYVNSYGDANRNNPTNSLGVRPSFYLKSGVKIKSGTGMPHDPYEIELPALGYITYNVNGQNVTAPEKQAFYGSSIKVNAELPDTDDYEFMGWTTTQNGSVVYQKGDTITPTKDMTLYAVWKEKVNTLYSVLESSLSSNLTTPDVDGTRYVKSAFVNNNYVSYSGKMWRVVALNSDGTVKLVTDEVQTEMAWKASKSETYENSSIRNYLNNEFLPTINNNFLADAKWDYTTYPSDSTFITKLPTTDYVTEKVGLLTGYELGMMSSENAGFYVNGDFSIEIAEYIYGVNPDNPFAVEYYEPFGNNYIDGIMWTMSPVNDGNIWLVRFDGASPDFNFAENINYDFEYGVFPSIVIKADTLINSTGNGTETSPYTIQGDN